MNDLFLGLDCSTQSLTGICCDFKSKKIICRESIIFDLDLQHYSTVNGIIPSENETVVHSYPLMWVEALELLFSRIKNMKIPLEEIKAISGSGQQHGTVYLKDIFIKKINKLNLNHPIIAQIKDTFTRETSPIWMDSSTSKQCEEIRKKLGGMKQTIKKTGSNTFERFSGPQIRKFFQESSEDYRKTAIIHLVSSFLASILVGRNAPIDHGDGSGMNLMNIKTKEWDNDALEATAPNLKDKLPKLCNPSDIIGKVSNYLVDKYNFNPDCLNIAWSGDNPNSLIGVGIVEKGKAAISLGTSDTYFGYLNKLNLDLKGEGHVFVAPTGDYMSLICFKNGSLARENIRDQFYLSWQEFCKVLKKSPAGNYGRIMLPYFFPEIVPLVLKPRVIRLGLKKDDLEGNVRAVIESQFLSMRLHSEWIGERPKEIYATGGASVNEDILQIAANIFNTKIKTFEFTDSAALGAALRATKSYYDSKLEIKEWQEIIEKFISVHDAIIIEPDNKTKSLYDDMLILYRNFEDYSLKEGSNPNSIQKEFIKNYF
ncbi:MAG: xylulokinase [Promethearchaeota archaeon]|jgi:xylulokinase